MAKANSKTRKTTTRSKSDPEILALSRVTKHAEAILAEFKTVGDEGAERIRDYLFARMGVTVTYGPAVPTK